MYSVNEPIQWVINPNAALFNVDMYASYVIELSNGKRLVTEPYSLACIMDHKPVISATYRVGNCNSRDPYPINVYIQVYANMTSWTGVQTAMINVYNTEKTIGLGAGYEILSEVKPSKDCSGWIPPATYDQVAKVCQSKSYIDRTNTPTAMDTIPVIVGEKTKKVGNYQDNLTVSPNPTSGIAIATYKIEEEGNVKLYMTDLAGKIVKTIIENELQINGHYTTNINVTDLAAGMYILVFESGTQRTLKKVVVSH